MGYVLSLVGLLTTGFFTLHHVRRGADTADDLIDAPRNIRAAAKRPRLAAKGGMPVIEGLPNPEIRLTALSARLEDAARDCYDTAWRALAKHVNCKGATVVGLVHMGPRVGPHGRDTAFKRLMKHLEQLDHGPWIERLIALPGHVAPAGRGGMPGARQADALGFLARVFRAA